MTDRLAELGKDLVIEEEEVDQQSPTQALPDDLIELQKREVLIKKDIERLRTYAEDIAKLVPTDDSSRDALTSVERVSTCRSQDTKRSRGHSK